MNFVQVIDKKSKGKKLNAEEIEFFVRGYVNDEIPDYQASAFLMAVKLKGFDDEELIIYTRELINSGETFPLNEELVDKHSSGGIGDKTSIALLPILSAMGLKIFKMSGRGLGFTGGTIDKLESVEGFNAELKVADFKKMVDEIGVSITGQTPKLVPADGKIYALRDITATVDSPQLIAASIISKKIASGAKNILIDLKVGSGAFMENVDDAKELARLMKLIAKDWNRNLFVLISSMSQPLGNYVGNKNEVYEAVESLKGNWPKDFYALIKKISTELYSKSKNVTLEEAEKVFDEVVNSGAALAKQKEWFEKHGVKDFEQSTKFNPAYKETFASDKDGFISFENVKDFGNYLIELKAGRKVKGDKLDFDSGIHFSFKTGDEIKKGQELFYVTSSQPIPDGMLEKIAKLITINENKKDYNVIVDEVTW